MFVCLIAAKLHLILDTDTSWYFTPTRLSQWNLMCPLTIDAHLEAMTMAPKVPYLKTIWEYCSYIRLLSSMFYPQHFYGTTWYDLRVRPICRRKTAKTGTMRTFLGLMISFLLLDLVDPCWILLGSLNFMRQHCVGNDMNETLSSTPKVYAEHAHTWSYLWIVMGVEVFEVSIGDWVVPCVSSYFMQPWDDRVVSQVPSWTWRSSFMWLASFSKNWVHSCPFNYSFLLNSNGATTSVTKRLCLRFKITILDLGRSISEVFQLQP